MRRKNDLVDLLSGFVVLTRLTLHPGQLHIGQHNG